ncbi:anti-sigma factor [Hymenobacter weizhouensis]|uniref:anti-sigma factor n=1 Tax=Hymenobacter sp. YIM 151500-1 TaxID=2987689 RepID=UPI002227BA11|nr:anti-sigma factor [Hymenobacter sp. YIM 151500-1]UYZ64395.1 anti-sigma factor [Hymenobacter sp. YIM 151500-1]
MDIQHYIESGILEEYALGLLSEAERADVERMAGLHPQVRQELDEALRGVEAYAQAHAVTPPAGMRERVLSGWQQAIRPETPALAMTASATPQPAPSAAAGEAVVRQMPPPAEVQPSRSRWLMAASVALLMLSGLGNVLLYNRLQESEANLLAARNEQARFAATQQAVERRLDARTQELNVLRSEQFRAVQLKGTPKAPQALARVYYNPGTRAVYVDVRRLPAPPAGKQYQLWALDNGKPVDAGVLTAATAVGDSIQQMKDIASAQAFAMTVEDEGGSAAPTLSTMTVIGNL